MNYEELLHEYFDGGLDEQRESVLFTALAHDVNLRQEFNDYVNLRSAMQSEVGSNTLPTALSASVFQGLGYSLPPALVTASSPEVGRASGGLMTYGAYILTSVLSSALTALVILLLLRPTSTVREVAQTIPATISPERMQRETSEPKFVPNTVPASTVSAPVVLSDRKTVRVVHPSLISDEVENPAPTRSDNEEDVAVTSAELRSIEQAIVSAPHHTLPTINSGEVLADMTSGSSFGLDVAIRSFTSRSFPSVELPDPAASSMIDFAVTALYALADNHAAGIEFGRESFGQEYRQTFSGNGVTVRQNPTLWWGGASYRLEFSDMALLPEMLYPYSQATIGMSEVGPLGRFLLGVRIIPEQRIVFSLGLEGSLLAYPVEKQWYSTTKLGLTYGVSIRF